jgi:esterase/lipase
MLELAAYLHGKGYWVYCVRLRGHGTSPEDLATRNGDDWTASVDIGFAVMNAICKRVVIGGFSFGGGLSLDAAARIKHLSGVFAVSPPFRLQDISSRFASAVTTWNMLMDKIKFPGAAKEYVEIVSEHPLINYARVPVAALSELERFMKGLESRLAEVTVPTLIVQGHGDPVVNAEGTALLFNRVGAVNKQYMPFDFNRHGILAGEGSENVHAAIGRFIEFLPAEV